jgi:hypothetical protein
MRLVNEVHKIDLYFKTVFNLHVRCIEFNVPGKIFRIGFMFYPMRGRNFKLFHIRLNRNDDCGVGFISIKNFSICWKTA